MVANAVSVGALMSGSDLSQLLVPSLHTSAGGCVPDRSQIASEVRGVLDAPCGIPNGVGPGELTQLQCPLCWLDLLDDPAQALGDLGDGVLAGGHVHREVLHVVVRRVGCLHAVEL